MNIKNLRHFLLISAILVFAVTNVVADVYDGNKLSAISKCTHQFSANFYQAVATEKSGNFISSPIGLNLVLSMLQFGAGGTTKEQLRSSLNLRYSDYVTEKGYQQLIDSLNSVTGVELQLANKLFASDDYELRPEFKEITKTYFRSETQNVDFDNRAEAAGTINNWCSEQTHNRITEILQADDLMDAVLVLLNAIYFKGAWKVKFDPKDTKNQTFYTSAENSLEVPMMRVHSQFLWGPISKLSASFIKLPYKNPNGDVELSMYIIRPDDINGLQKIETNFDNINFGNLRGYSSQVDLHLPKFKIESTFNLQPTLTKMGLSEIFRPRANFTGMNDKKSVHVSKVIQKAFIEVNEEGCEAAAVTAVVMMSRSAFGSPIIKLFEVNRPFVYAIVHERTKTVLFQGRVQDPTEK